LQEHRLRGTITNPCEKEKAGLSPPQSYALTLFLRRWLIALRHALSLTTAIRLFTFLALGASALGIDAANAGEEGLGDRSCRNLAGEDLVIESLTVTAIDGAGRVVVLVDHGAFQRHAGEQTSAARVGEDAGASGPIGRGRGMTPDRSCGCAGLTADLKLILQQHVHAFVAHDGHHQVDALNTDLCTPASPADGEEGGRGPTARGAAGSEPASKL